MRHFYKKSRRLQLGKWPSTVASRPTILCSSARKGICGRSPSRAGHKIVAIFKETASGADNVRPERAKDPGVARAHEIDAILVTELSRWGRSTKTLSKRSTICTAGHQGFGPPSQAKSRR